MRSTRNPLRDRRLRTRPFGDPQARLLHVRLGHRSPLAEAPDLARDLHVGRVSVKDERDRFGLPSFKALGASWAVCSELAGRLGVPEAGADPQLLRSVLAASEELTVVCASEGNHGRSVARYASWLGARSIVVASQTVSSARIRAITEEGAEVRVVAGDYDRAVEFAAGLVDGRHLLIADTSWPGYTEVPRRVMDGYATLFDEMDHLTPDVVMVPIGVGSLAAAAAAHYRRRPGPPVLIGVEPTGFACALESVLAGRPVTVTSARGSVMTGLNCGRLSSLAWPAVSAGFDAFCAVEDSVAEAGMHLLASAGFDAGACSGAVVGAARWLGTAPEAHSARLALGIDERAHILLPLTEGVTDSDHFTRVVGRRPASPVSRQTHPVAGQ